jgi:RNA polymerase sigma-70 factor (ECF subfamily)
VEDQLMDPANDESDSMLLRARDGDDTARRELLTRHRARLKRMIAVRMDRRLAPRCDPSDVVQQTLFVALQQLPEYIRDPPLPFYPWLRQLAWKRLNDLYQKHIIAQRRSIRREQPADLLLSDESMLQLADRLASSGTSPSGLAMRAELRARMETALAALPERDREILVMRHIEGLSIKEIAAILAIREDAVKMRRRRALVRLKEILTDASKEGRS